MASYGMKGPYEGMKSGGMKVRQTPNFTPEQMQIFAQSQENVSPDSYLSRLAGGDQSFFNEIEQPALRQFGELQGGLASRFSGMGGMGARRSSGFQNTMNTAAQDFASQLQQQRQSLQRQAIMDLSGLQHQLLGERPYDTRLEERRPKQSFWQKAAPYAGAAIGGVIGGPSGALAGYQMGNTFSGSQQGQPQSFKNDLPSSWGSMFGNGQTPGIM
jgi:membrane protease subunit (stomatin/prohibitin family)